MNSIASPSHATFSSHSPFSPPHCANWRIFRYLLIIPLFALALRAAATTYYADAVNRWGQGYYLHLAAPERRGPGAARTPVVSVLERDAPRSIPDPQPLSFTAYPSAPDARRSLALQGTPSACGVRRADQGESTRGQDCLRHGGRDRAGAWRCGGPPPPALTSGRRNGFGGRLVGAKGTCGHSPSRPFGTRTALGSVHYRGPPVAAEGQSRAGVGAASAHPHWRPFACTRGGSGRWGTPGIRTEAVPTDLGPTAGAGHRGQLNAHPRSWNRLPDAAFRDLASIN